MKKKERKKKKKIKGNFFVSFFPQKRKRALCLFVVNSLVLLRVVFTDDGRAVDTDATAALRNTLRTKRAWSNPPAVSWDDAGTTNALDTAEQES